MLEQEIKLTAGDGDVLDEVLQSDLIAELAGGEGADAVRYLGSYYDTADGALTQKRFSLRTRLEGERRRATLKFGGQIENGLSQRQELQIDLDAQIADPITCAAQLPDGEIKTKVTDIISPHAPLIVRVTVDMQRSIRHLNFRASEIELSIDKGIIHGRTNQTALFELELELVSGEVDDIIALGETLRREYNLTPSTKTKHRIGLELG